MYKTFGLFGWLFLVKVTVERVYKSTKQDYAEFKHEEKVSALINVT